ncbi:MAG TPA: glycosyltransferase family 4 protein [Stellaceae bacterium]|nr:glycosyltransferase family 4 protein [Stellaceae bacterium]
MTSVERDQSVLVIGPMPPPVTGYSVITEFMIARLKEAAHVDTIDISADSLVRDVFYHLRRVARVSRALWALATRPVARGRILYLAVSGGAGVVYDLLLVSVARLRGYRMFIHHHAFAYLDRHSRLTAALMSLAGSATTHICLCPTMASRLRERYPGARRTTVLSNAAFIAPTEMERPSHHGPTRVGFLSNLTPEKGLDTAIEIFRLLRAVGGDFVLTIGGPAPTPESRGLIDRAGIEFGPALDYRGPVYGAAKGRFFQDLDVLLFPTRYANEAEPLVMLEALAAGVPVIASARGCIPDDLADGGVVQGTGSEFSAAVAALLSEWASDRTRMAELSMSARGRAARLHDEARRELERLIAAIVPLSSEPSGESARA